MTDTQTASAAPTDALAEGREATLPRPSATDAEQHMARMLAGQFVAVRYDGNLVQQSVSREFVPNYSRMIPDRREPADIGEYFRRTWSDDEDALLVSMRAEDAPYYEIAKRMKRGEQSIRHRYRFLAARDGFEIRKPKNMRNSVPDEVLAKITDMHRNKYRRAEIAKAVSMSDNQVKKLLQSLRDRNRVRIR